MLKAKGVKGECIELQGALTDVNAVNRSKAWNEHGKASGAYETVVQVPTDWKPDLYLSGLTNALRAHPEANCVFAASDFAWNAIQSALEGANRYAPAGQPNHVWMATQDLFPPALPAVEQGYIDVATTYDAFAHAQEADPGADRDRQEAGPGLRARRLPGARPGRHAGHGGQAREPVVARLQGLSSGRPGRRP